MQLACCQLDITWENKTANTSRVEALVEAARLPPGTLLLLPEMFATGFTMNAAAVAEPPDGFTASFLALLARHYRLFVQAGVVVRENPDATPRNEALIFGPDGRLLARYAKIHLFSYAGEPTRYAPGDSPLVFPWQAPDQSTPSNPSPQSAIRNPQSSPQATVTPAICYDLRFPELFRRAVREGAEALTLIACWPAPREEHWLALLRARAIENQCFVAAANRCGRDPSGLAYGGRSQIIDPRGVVLADAGSQEGVIQAEIDLAGQRRYRCEFPALNDMRFY